MQGVHLYAAMCDCTRLSQWEHTEDTGMKIDLLSNEKPQQHSSEGESEGEERGSEVMK